MQDAVYLHLKSITTFILFKADYETMEFCKNTTNISYLENQILVPLSRFL